MQRMCTEMGLINSNTDDLSWVVYGIYKPDFCFKRNISTLKITLIDIKMYLFKSEFQNILFLLIWIFP